MMVRRLEEEADEEVGTRGEGECVVKLMMEEEEDDESIRKIQKNAETKGAERRVV